MNGLSPRAPRLHERVVDDVVGSIVSGAYKAGTALPPETEMAARFGVSPSVVREALRVLGEKGLIDVRQGSGTRVTGSERWDPLDAALLSARRERGTMAAVLSDLLEARRIVECEVAALAAERATPQALDRMRDALDTMRTALDDPPRFIVADTAFHESLLATTGNRVLERMFEPMRELLRFSQQTTDSIPGVLERALRDHEAIALAVERRDPAGARDAMRAHLGQTERDVKNLLEVP